MFSRKVSNILHKYPVFKCLQKFSKSGTVSKMFFGSKCAVWYSAAVDMIGYKQ
jgi:hypothetical protein